MKCCKIKYGEKPIVVDSIEWDGENFDDIKEFNEKCYREVGGDVVFIDTLGTLEGLMIANKGDYIIKDDKGEIYPCAKNIFEDTYMILVGFVDETS